MKKGLHGSGARWITEYRKILLVPGAGLEPAQP